MLRVFVSISLNT